MQHLSILKIQSLQRTVRGHLLASGRDYWMLYAAACLWDVQCFAAARWTS